MGIPDVYVGGNTIDIGIEGGKRTLEPVFLGLVFRRFDGFTIIHFLFV